MISLIMGAANKEITKPSVPSGQVEVVTLNVLVATMIWLTVNKVCGTNDQIYSVCRNHNMVL